MPKEKWIKTNRYKPGTAKYYKDQLENIVAVAIDYDGYDPNNAKQMRELVDELKAMAGQSLRHEKLYVTTCDCKGKGKCKKTKK